MGGLCPFLTKYFTSAHFKVRTIVMIFHKSAGLLIDPAQFDNNNVFGNHKFLLPSTYVDILAINDSFLHVQKPREVTTDT